VLTPLGGTLVQTQGNGEICKTPARSVIANGPQAASAGFHCLVTVDISVPFDRDATAAKVTDRVRAPIEY